MDNRLEVIDRDGWRKEFQLARPIVRVGSDPQNDIVLDSQRGGGVSARHLQLIAVGPTALRAINLGDQPVSLLGGTPRPITPRGIADIAEGDRVQIGEFTLVVHLGAAPVAPAAAPPVTPPAAAWSVPAAPPPAAPAPQPAAPPAAVRAAPAALPPAAPSAPPAARDEPLGPEAASANIGARLSLSEGPLQPDKPLEGSIAVRNLGNEAGVQFRLELLGFEAGCYELGPGPLVFPGVERSTFFRLHHPQRPEPHAGRHAVQVRVTAPDAYPNESVVVSQVIEILPYYRHSLRLVAS